MSSFHVHKDCPQAPDEICQNILTEIYRLMNKKQMQEGSAKQSVASKGEKISITSGEDKKKKKCC